MLTIIILLAVVLGLASGAAYRRLPYRFGVPVLLVTLGVWFAWLATANQGGISDEEGRALALTLLIGLVAFMLGVNSHQLSRLTSGRSPRLSD